jgi:hypothetical protein
MNKKLALRTAKLASESQKIKGISNVCTAYEHQPRNPDERRHGILFGVIDISGSPRHAEDLIEIIIDTFHSEYYQDLDKDPLESFEDALSKINEELGEFTNNGQTFWMGKLNTTLAVYADNTIHITQTGKSEAYLYRGGKENHITEDLAGDSVNPLRTFINITSGELTEGDKISILSSGILITCSSEEISKYIRKYHPKIAVGHIADMIEGLGGSYGQNAAILLEFLSPDTLANEVLDDEPDEIWLQGTSKKEIMAEKTTTVLQKIFKYIRLGTVMVAEFYTNTLVPKTVSAFKGLKNKVSEISKNRTSNKDKSPNVLTDTEEKLEGFETEEVPETEENITAIEDTDGPKAKIKEQPAYKSEIRIKESDESPGKAKFEKTKGSIINNLGSLYGSATNLASFKRTKRKMPKIKMKKNHYLAIGVAILLLFLPYLYITKISQTGAKTKKEQQAQLEQIDSKIAEANTLAGQNEKQKASAILENAIKMTEELTDSKFFSEEAKQKLAEMKSQLTTITQTTEISPDVLVDLTGVAQSDVVGIYSLKNTFYAIGQNGDISKVEKKSQKASILQTSGEIEGNVVAATALPRIRTVELLTDKPAIYEFDADDNSITEKKAADGWEKAIDIDSYGTSLYLLSSEASQIYKHTRTSSGYSKGFGYLDNTEDMENPITLKIDTNIYVLENGGKLQKFTSGKKQDFVINDLPVNLGSADLLYTDTVTDNILIASKNDKYIVVAGKDGTYKGRYISNDFADMKYVTIEGNTIYVATKNKVLSFDIK